MAYNLPLKFSILIKIKSGITFICRFYRRPIKLVGRTPTVNYTGRVTEEISTPNKTYRRGQQIDERRTGTNKTNGMGRW